MGGFFGVASRESAVFDLFYGTDYHSHLGTRRAGMAVPRPANTEALLFTPVRPIGRAFFLSDVCLRQQ